MKLWVQELGLMVLVGPPTSGYSMIVSVIYLSVKFSNCYSSPQLLEMHPKIRRVK